MTIADLKKWLNELPSEYDDLEVWVDSDYGEGGPRLNIENFAIQPFEQGCHDLDDGSETIYDDEILEMFGLDELPELGSLEFTKIHMALIRKGYEFYSFDQHGLVFTKKVLAIKIY